MEISSNGVVVGGLAGFALGAALVAAGVIGLIVGIVLLGFAAVFLRVMFDVADRSEF